MIEQPDRAQRPSREALIVAFGVVALAAARFGSQTPWLGPRYAIYGWFAANVLLLLAAPLAFVRGILRERPADFGFSLGRPRVWLRDLAIAALLLAPVAVIAPSIPGLRPHYLPYRDLAGRLASFAVLTLGWGAYFFAWEWFFRGFFLMGLARRYGRLAIVLQLVPFVLAHIGKSTFEVLASVPGGLLLGWVALRGETFLASWLLHWLCASAINLSFVLAASGLRLPAQWTPANLLATMFTHWQARVLSL